MDNPFNYSEPIVPSKFFGRAGEYALLLKKIRENNPVRLSAPRRYGKTSLLLKLGNELRNSKDLCFIYIDLFGVTDKEEVLGRFKEGYFEYLPEKIRKKVFGDLDKVTRSTGREAGTAVPLFNLRGLGSTAKQKYSLLTEEGVLLNAPRKIQEHTKKKSIIVLDEFQDIFPITNMDKILRSRFEKQGNAANYVFAGSHKTLMEKLFTSKERAFYAQATALPVNPIAAQEVENYLLQEFSSLRRDVGEEVKLISEFSLGHPQRATLVAYFLWEILDAGSDLGTPEENTSYAVCKALKLLEQEMITEWNSYSLNEKKVLKKVVVTAGKPYSQSAVNNTIKMPKTTTADTLKDLRGKDVLHKTDSRWVFFDPFLEVWIKGKFFN